MATLDAVCTAIRSYRYRFTNEKELQDGIELALAGAKLDFDREVRLAPGDIPDFLVEPGIAVEVKVAGSPNEIMRQLSRYAASPRVTELLLVTRKTQHAHQFPDAIGGKPLRVSVLEGCAL
jgi:hypothetical protein